MTDNTKQTPTDLVARGITREVLDEFCAWTRKAPIFTSCPKGRVLGEELREAFGLAWEALESRDAAAYLAGLKEAGWSDEEILDLLEETADVE